MRYILLHVLFFLAVLSGCSDDRPIKIGFAGGLTGRHADLGIYGRNGVLLAIEETNARGGIDGRQLQLLIKDDEQQAQVARKVVQELIDAGVVAIIGHFTSAMSVVTVPLANSHSVLMFSPTTATDSLTGIDDYFIRAISPNQTSIEILANYVMEKKHGKKVVVIYDDQNRAFGIEWFVSFAQRGKALQVDVKGLPFTAGPEYGFANLARNALADSPDSVVIVAAALDAAMICQQIRKIDDKVSLYTTMWSMSEDFLQNAGSAGDGVVFANWFDPDYPGEQAVAFRRNYTKRFGREPNFSSNFAYETASILIEALKSGRQPAHLKNTILEIGHFEGLQGSIDIDSYGDTKRSFFLMQVKNGGYERVK